MGHTMNTRTFFAAAFVSLLLAGCVSTTGRKPQKASWRLVPELDPATPLQIYVQDRRPAVELEKTPSTGHVYSGAVFNVQGDAVTVATGLQDLADRFGGAQNIQLAAALPARGPALVFTLDHWYSKAPINLDKPPLTIHGEFSGTIALYRDGRMLASRHISAKGEPSVVGPQIVFDRQRSQTPRVIAGAMERTANSSQQKAYEDIMKFLQPAWRKFQQPAR